RIPRPAHAHAGRIDPARGRPKSGAAPRGCLSDRGRGRDEPEVARRSGTMAAPVRRAGRVAQGESTRLTSAGAQVRNLPRPPPPTSTEVLAKIHGEVRCQQP